MSIETRAILSADETVIGFGQWVEMHIGKICMSFMTQLSCKCALIRINVIYL